MEDTEFFDFNKNDCLSLYNEVGKLKSSEDITTQLKITKLAKYRRLLEGELMWQSSSQYIELIDSLMEQILVDDLNKEICFKTMNEFSININKKIKLSSKCGEFLLNNSIMLTPSEIGIQFSNQVIKMVDCASFYNELSSIKETINLLDKIAYFEKSINNLINDYLDDSI